MDAGRCALETLDGLAQRCRTAWPTIDLDPDVFRDHLRALFIDGSVDLTTVHSDIYWACASLHGVAAARDFLESGALIDAPKAVRRVSTDPDLVEEVVADLRVALLSCVGDKPPLLSRYQGRGPLRSFVMVLATRRALDRKRRQKEILSAQPGVDMISPVDVTTGEQHELAAEFLVIFKKHLEALPAKERAVLRQHVVEGASLDSLARAHRAHRATIARWIASAKQAVFDATRAELSRRRSWGPDTFQSFARQAAVDMDVTLSTFLQEGAAPKQPR